MKDRITEGLDLLDREAPRKDIVSQTDPGDPRRRSYTVPTLEGRKQVVFAAPVADSLTGERLDLASICVSSLPKDADLMVGLLSVARDLRRARICLLDRNTMQLAVVASFIPDELHEGNAFRLLAALREVAAVADSIEKQVIGGDLG